MCWRSDGLVPYHCLVATDSLAVDLCENCIIIQYSECIGVCLMMENWLKHPDDLTVWKSNATAKNIYCLLERKKKDRIGG